MRTREAAWLAAVSITLLAQGSWAAPVQQAAAPPKTAAASEESRVDAVVAGLMQQRHVPGASIAVVRDGKLLLAKGYGHANVELEAPATADTVYQLASVTKQFTAAATLLLIDDGKLALEDKVTERLSGLPASWKDVTVRHLLTHTSGIPSYTSQRKFNETPRKDFTAEELIKVVAELPMDFQPGEKWSYNNTGYYLLGMLIEKVSGRSYGEFLDERIFKPLGMKDTRVNDLSAVIPRRAHGYTWRGKLVNGEYVSPTQPFAAGALVSTVKDMAKWDAALYTDHPLKASLREQSWTAEKLTGGAATTYGFGWGIDQVNGHRLIQHGGGIPGFSTQISRFVDDRLTVIVLTNLDGGGAGVLARGVAGVYVPALAPEERKAIEDKDLATTATLRRVFEDMAKGTIDPSLFAESAREFFTERAKEAKTVLGQMGALRSFELLAEQTDGAGRTRMYRVTLGTTRLLANFHLNKEGRITAAGIRPE